MNKKQKHTPEQHALDRTKTFYSRVVNLTPIQFNKEEDDLLNKGLQYNLSYNNSKQWLERLIIETEVAISKLPENQHDGFRYLAKQNILKIIMNKKAKSNIKKSLDFKILKSIKQKLIDNNLSITHAGKGKTLVIITNEELQNKVLVFTNENHLKRLDKDPTKKFQKNVKEAIKNCKKVIDKYTKFKCIQIKLQAPKLNITIKLHKEGASIRPIVSYKYAPSYYITKITANWLKRHLELQFEYNVENSLKCAEKNQRNSIYI
jgi:UDP-N-acetylglucosamine transferase subunit ALG13